MLYLLLQWLKGLQKLLSLPRGHPASPGALALGCFWDGCQLHAPSHAGYWEGLCLLIAPLNVIK